MSQQNPLYEFGGSMQLVKDNTFALDALQNLDKLLNRGPVLVALRKTPRGDVYLESLAECHCNVAEGANHLKGCSFLKGLQQLDSLRVTIGPPKSQPACDEVPPTPSLGFPTIHDLDNPRHRHPGAIFQEEIMKTSTPTATEASLRRVTIEKRLKITVSLED